MLQAASFFSPNPFLPSSLATLPLPPHSQLSPSLLAPSLPFPPRSFPPHPFPPLSSSYISSSPLPSPFLLIHFLLTPSLPFPPHPFPPQLQPSLHTGLATAFPLYTVGVATAFAAPIGGLLFTIEEGASFYSTSIFWRGFLSTCIGVLTLHFLVSCAVGLPSSLLASALFCPATMRCAAQPSLPRLLCGRAAFLSTGFCSVLSCDCDIRISPFTSSSLMQYACLALYCCTVGSAPVCPVIVTCACEDKLSLFCHALSLSCPVLLHWLLLQPALRL